uniref:Uncharacterized protein n=1 Tax=Tanacetum cinerariifolium TaxID=118510 RepID=A0A699HFN4_TANCI|nr:hypothetical protein [Tanacetum cinerariifolium]
MTHTMKAQQIALDDALVVPANSLKIWNCNHRLSSDLKSNKPTIQVVLDALKLTPFYNAFKITANVLEIYMQEFWATVSTHRHSLRFKLNGRCHTLNVENLRDMLRIGPRLPGQRFKDLPLEEEFLSFIRDLSHTREVKVLTDLNVNYMHQPWRSFDAIINRCLSGKTIGLDSLLLSLENKNSKKNNDMCYLRFTKVIIDNFMSKNQSMSRRNKMFWYNARDDPMFNIIRFISRYQDTQVYDAILLVELTNQEMLDSKAYKQYYAVSSKAKPPKEKIKLKSKTKVTKPDMKKQLSKKTKAKGLAVLSKVTLSEAKQIKMATKRSKKDFHISHASGSGNGVDTQSKVPDEQVQNTSGTDEGTDEDDNDGNDDDAESDDRDNDSDDERSKSDSVHTPSDNEFTDEEKLDDKETMDDEEDDEKADKPIQISYVSSNFTSKFLNLENPSPSDNEIASLMKTLAPYAIVILELISGRDDQDKDEDPSTGSDQGTKRRKSSKDDESSKDSRSKEKKSSRTSKEASQSQHKNFGKSVCVEEPSHTVEESGMQQDREFITGDNDEQPVDKKLYKFKEGDFKRLHLQDIEDMLLLLVQQMLTNLTIDKRKKRSMYADVLHKFSDGTLNDVRSVLYDIATRKDGISANEEMDQLRQENGSGYGSRNRQTAISWEVDAESRKVCWWKTLWARPLTI